METTRRPMLHLEREELSLSLSKCITVNEYISELRDVTCHMGSLPPDTFECAPPSAEPSRSVLDLPPPEGWKAELAWVPCLHTKTVYPRSPISVLTRLDVE